MKKMIPTVALVVALLLAPAVLARDGAAQSSDGSDGRVEQCSGEQSPTVLQSRSNRKEARSNRKEARGNRKEARSNRKEARESGDARGEHKEARSERRDVRSERKEARSARHE